MALIPLTADTGDVHLAYDTETLVLLLVKGGGPAGLEVIGPAIQTVTPALDLAAELESTLVVAGAVATTAILPAPGNGKANWVYGYVLGFGATGTYQWLSALHPLSGAIDMAAIGENDGIVPVTGYPYLKCNTNEALNMTTVGAAGTAEGFIIHRTVGG